MSRQRIRSSVLESSTEKCPHCGGTGHVRSVSSVALQLLRAIEEMLLKGATHNLIVRTRTETALYLLNHKRAHLRELEDRFQLTLTVNADATVIGQVSYVIEKGEQVHSIEQAKALVAARPASIAPPAAEEDYDEPIEELDEVAESDNVEQVADAEEDDHEEGVPSPEAAQSEGERNGRKRRRRRRGRRGGDGREGEAPAAENGAGPSALQGAAQSADEREPLAGSDAEAETEFGAPEVQGESHADGEKRRRRRGRRGGRRARQGRDGEALPPSSDSAPAFETDESPELHQAEPEHGDHAADAERKPDQWEPQAVSHQPQPDRSEPGHESPYQRDHAEAGAQQRAAEVGRDRDHDRLPAEPIPAPSGGTPARRGSTVREPAPTSFSFSEISASTPEPASSPAPSSAASAEEAEPPVPATSQEGEGTARPRRAGWWSKRVLGKG
jgi:ribonuclease E